MGTFVCNGALMQCSFGMSPISLVVADPTRPKISNLPMANIMDYVPLTNIPSFGMCQSMANPTVASATAAALGTLTPMPCVPVISAPWSPGAQNAKVANFNALTNSCKCVCAYGGSISITYQGHASTAKVD